MEAVRGTPLFPQLWEKTVEGWWTLSPSLSHFSLLSFSSSPSPPGILVHSTYKKQMVAIDILDSIILPNVTKNEVKTAGEHIIFEKRIFLMILVRLLWFSVLVLSAAF